MLRHVLAISLTFVLAAGPGLCCCTSARLIAGAVPPAGQDGPHAPTAPQRPCCHDPCGSPAEPSPAPDRQQEATGSQAPARDSTPGDHRCPCREHGCKQKLDRAASPSPFEQTPTRSLLPIAEFLPFNSLAGSSLTAAHGGGFGDASLLPFLSAWELLHVHHQLRC